MISRLASPAVLALVLLASCSAGPADTTLGETGPAARSLATTTTGVATANEYRPGREAHLFLPRGEASAAPLVVMVPGGGWRTADPAGLAGLADHLAEAGQASLAIEVGAAETGAFYPTPVEDVHCAVGYGLLRLGEAGIEPSGVVLLGHSSGAHLAALAALTGPDPVLDCPHPGRAADGLVGLAGVYDVSRLPALALLLFGVSPDDDPARWEEGNPVLQAGRRPELPVLLMHGTEDQLVPLSFTDDFATALVDGGHTVEAEVVEDADHREIYSAEVAGPLIADWIERTIG